MTSQSLHWGINIKSFVELTVQLNLTADLNSEKG